MIGDIKYSINELPFNELNNIPIGFQCGKEGNFTITFEGIKELENSQDVTLEDLKEDVFINLDNQDSYTFDASTEDNAMRFILHFGALGEEEISSDNSIEVYSNEDMIFIQNPANLQGVEMDIMNVNGQIIHHSTLSSNTLSSLKLDIPTAYYFVRFQTKDRVYTKKLFVK